MAMQSILTQSLRLPLHGHGHGHTPPPTHTHTLIRNAQDGSTWHPTHYASTLPINTNAVLLLDAQISVDCNDLKFAHSVWRSAKDTLVGTFVPLPLSFLHRMTITSVLI